MFDLALIVLAGLVATAFLTAASYCYRKLNTATDQQFIVPCIASLLIGVYFLLIGLICWYLN